MKPLEKRTCGNCIHRSPGGKCRHLGSPLVYHKVDADMHPCAWHRDEDENDPLSAPCQLAPRNDLARIGECNWPRDLPRRRGWTEKAAAQVGVKLIQEPAARRHALPYTQGTD